MVDYFCVSEQQEVDFVVFKGCGIFEFFKKKLEDVFFFDVIKENKGEEKFFFVERIYFFDSFVCKFIDIFVFWKFYDKF